MSSFINKLKLIKKDSYNLDELNIQELIEEFNFQESGDKKYIFGDYNSKKYIGHYDTDVFEILKALICNNKLSENEEIQIINNYKKKYSNNSVKSLFALSYIKLFIDKTKTVDFKAIFKDLYNKHDINKENAWEFMEIFYQIKDEEYFIKAFKKDLDIRVEYGTKYFHSFQIDYLLKINKSIFSDFILSLSSHNLAYFKSFDNKEVINFIEKVKKIGDSEINIHLKNLFLGCLDYKDEKIYSYEVIEQFFKSDFAIELNAYLGTIFDTFDLDILKKTKDNYFGIWETVNLISKILRIDNIKELCNISGEGFYDVHIYENIEGSNRQDKKEILKEFKKHKEFTKKLRKRQRIFKTQEQQKIDRETKKRDEFDKNIEAVKEITKKDSNSFSEYLLYQFENTEYKDFKEDIEVIKLVKEHINRFFISEASNPDIFELNYTKKSESGSSYTTHTYVVHNTFLRCLKLYKQFGLEITNDIREKAIKYIPFAYSSDLETIKSVIEGNLSKKEVDYLISIYDGTRIKDDLRFFGIQTFLQFYSEYKDDFLKHSKKYLQDTLLKIINDNGYKGYEREYTAKKFLEVGEQKQLIDIFNKYKSDKNYFSDILNLEIKGDEKINFDIAISAGINILKRFSDFEDKEKIINWYISQLEQRISLIEDISDGIHFRGVSDIESEISWFGRDDDKFITSFKYINDLKYETRIKELLKYSFKIFEEGKEYKIFGIYIQKAVVYFYEGIEKKRLETVFELEKYVYDLKVKNDETRILFKTNYLDNLVSIYSKNLKASDITKAYKNVYKTKKDSSNEKKELEKEVIFLKKEKKVLELENIKIKNKFEELKKDLKKYRIRSSVDDSIILFVEGKTDKRYLELAYKALYNKDFPYKIEILFGKDALRNYLDDLELLKYCYSEGKIFISLFDFDSAYNSFNGLNNKWEYLRDEINKHIKRKLINNESKCYAFLLPANLIHNDIKKNIYQGGDETKGHFGCSSEFEIEHLFYGVIDIIDNCYEDKNVIGGGNIKVLKGDKMSFCNTIIKLNNEEKIDLFKNFEPIFKIIEEIIEDSKKE